MGSLRDRQYEGVSLRLCCQYNENSERDFNALVEPEATLQSQHKTLLPIQSEQCVLFECLGRARGDSTITTSIVFFQFLGRQIRVCFGLVVVFFLFALRICEFVGDFF